MEIIILMAHDDGAQGFVPELVTILNGTKAKKRRKTVLKLPPISTRNPKALVTVVNNALANAVLPRMEPGDEEWAEWLAVFDAHGEADLLCVYCGRTAELLDHLNPTIIEKRPSGFFAELGNLVPACRPCNESRGNKPWEPWLRAKHSHHGEQTIERRVAVMRRFEQWRKPERLDPRNCGDPQKWSEYDHVRHEIHKLLGRAQTIADELRANVTADFQQLRKSRESVSAEVSTGDYGGRRPVSTNVLPEFTVRLTYRQNGPMNQRDMMRELIAKHGRDEKTVCKEYALAESRGEVPRQSNEHDLTPEEYAHALWKDGERKGWF